MNLPITSLPDALNLSGIDPDLGLGDPAEVLVELAKRGDIDPWDIDIARTTEKFLAYIDSLERGDLRIPARTLLYASTLLRMKSDAMEWFREEVEPEPEPLPEPEDDPSRVRNLPAQPIRRKTKRPVTLEELISELKKAELVGRRKAIRDMLPTPLAEEKRLDLSHEEGIEERIKVLEAIVDDVFVTREVATFQEVNWDKDVLNYVSLLFMAQRKKVWLDQEEFFGELFIKRRPQNDTL